MSDYTVKPRVRLIAKTVPVIEDHKTPEELIAYCARVSNPKNQNNTATADKLLKYLIDHKHWSPFELVNLVFEIIAPRDISRQLLRHQLKFQEFSQRYAYVGREQICLREARLQDSKNRQNSIETEDKVLQAQWEEKQISLIGKAHETYDWAIKKGIAKEQARVVLPEGLTLSTLYVNGYLRNWIHYCAARRKKESGTQKEHREIAAKIFDIIIQEFPSLRESLGE